MSLLNKADKKMAGSGLILADSWIKFVKLTTLWHFIPGPVHKKEKDKIKNIHKKKLKYIRQELCFFIEDNMNKGQ